MQQAISSSPFQQDITAPEGEVQIQIRADGTVLWIHVEGITVLRICRIQQLTINDERPDYKHYTQDEIDAMLGEEWQAGFVDGQKQVSE